MLSDLYALLDGHSGNIWDQIKSAATTGSASGVRNGVAKEVSIHSDLKKGALSLINKVRGEQPTLQQTEELKVPRRFAQWLINTEIWPIRADDPQFTKEHQVSTRMAVHGLKYAWETVIEGKKESATGHQR